MTRCEETLEALALRLGQEIDPGREVALNEHLAGCPACAREAAAFRDLQEALQVEALPDPGPLYWASFQKRLRQRIVSRQRARRARAVAVGLAASALLAIGISAWIQRGSGGPSHPDQTDGSGAARADGSLAETRLDAALDRLAEQRTGSLELESLLDDLVADEPMMLEDNGDWRDVSEVVR
jgi:anti-sigma factor RsiW